MRLEIAEEIIVETYGSLEEHTKKINKELDNLKPDYYTLVEDIIGTTFVTKILILVKY